jgi:hypothetical protein
MAWFKKKADPISERARALNAEIAALESKIKRFESQAESAPSGPKLRSTAIPRSAELNKPAPSPVPSVPVFEKVDTQRLMKEAESTNPADLYNEFGVRRYDLPGLVRRWRDHFRKPTANNPKLVNYLAAGGFQGMRPLRREKRIARNRTIALAIILLLALLGMWAVFGPGH